MKVVIDTESESDRIIFNEIFNDKVYDNVLKRNKNARRIVDIGGNFGGFVAKAHEICKNARIEVYEPNPFSNIKEIPLLNEKCNVMIFPYAVAGKNEKRELYIYKDSGLSSLIYQEYRDINKRYSHIERVQAYALDTIIENGIDILKIDCEGAEYEILMNCTRLKKIKVIVGEWHEFLDYHDHNIIYNKLAHNGFDVIEFNKQRNTAMFVAVNV